MHTYERQEAPGTCAGLLFFFVQLFFGFVLIRSTPTAGFTCHYAICAY